MFLKGSREFVEQKWSGEKVKHAALEEIVRAWKQIELQSVIARLRPVCFASLDLIDVRRLAAELKIEGLAVVPLQTIATNGPTYSAVSTPADGATGLYRCVIGRNDYCHEFAKALQDSDHSTLGHLLGYPTCCQRSFVHLWHNLGVRDPTWQAAEMGQSELAVVNLQGPYHNNIFLRALGLRALFHLPCSLLCLESVRVAEDLMLLGVELGLTSAMRGLEVALREPVLWSSVNGIATITTSAVTISMSTDYTSEHREIHWSPNS